MHDIKGLLMDLSKGIARFSDRFGSDVRYDPDGPFSYAAGATLIMNILNSRPEILEKIYVKDFGKKEVFHDRVIEEACRRRIKLEYVHTETPQKVGRVCSVVGVYRKWEDHIQPGTHVVLVDPTLARNVGAVMRTALAFGIHDMAVISEDGFDSFEPNVNRTSMGTRLMMRVERFPDIETYTERFPENNRYAFMLDGASKLSGTVFEEPCSLIFGNETLGLPAEYAQLCTPVFIEQSSELDSLNLFTAAGIAMYTYAMQKKE